jgi:hypothetical protein
MTGRFHLGQSKSAVNVSSVPASTHHARGFQNGQVLRKIRLRNGKRFLEGRDPFLSPAKYVEQLKALGVSESTADRCLPFEHFQIESGWLGSHRIWRPPQSKRIAKIGFCSFVHPSV